VEELVATGQSHKTGTATALCASQGVYMKVGTKVLHSKYNIACNLHSGMGRALHQQPRGADHSAYLTSSTFDRR
jgi:hypothetical protein